MYKFVCICDECGKVLYDGLESKRDACNQIRQEGGFAAMGIHLCPEHATKEIRQQYVRKKRDWRI